MVPSESESRITTDADQIESWAREHDVVPVREGGHLRLVDEGAFDDARMERVDWADFESALTESDRVVVYHESEERTPLELRHREEALTHFEGEQVEEQLLAGEVVTGTIRETAVVERTIVEEAEIQSEVINREIVDRQVVEADLLSRECTTCTLRESGADGHLETYDADYFLGEAGDDYLAKEEELTFDLDAHEAWAVTLEELEELTVESRVTDVDMAESDAVEDIDLESDVDLEGVQRQLIESDLFDLDVEELEGLDAEAHAIESEIHEGESIRTTLTQDRTIEREVAMAHEVTATGTESRRTNVQTAHEDVISGGLAGRGQTMAGEMTAGETAPEDSAVGRMELTSDDEGKTVVDAAGEELGMVTEVDEGVAYVDAHPSVTEKVKAKLGWGEADDEDYAVGPDQIARITDDRIELSGTE